MLGRHPVELFDSQAVKGMDEVFQLRNIQFVDDEIEALTRLPEEGRPERRRGESGQPVRPQPAGPGPPR